MIDGTINQYLPDDQDLHKLPRQWIINVCYSVLGKPFGQWVMQGVEQRHEKLA